MNVEFHYYAIYFLGLRAGFSDHDAQLIAYSSQFVDHNIISYRIKNGRTDYTLEPTQNYGFWDESFPTEVYVPFHFFPGDSDFAGARRRDGGYNRFNTTPNSPRVKQLLIDALETRNLYRIGIALHTYADSWAHQNFSGRMELWNQIDASSPIPAIGHAQATTKPDNIEISWEDPRLPEPYRFVSNFDRFMRAARQIYKYLATYNRRAYDDVDVVQWELEEVVGTKRPRVTGKERIQDFIIRDTMTPYERSAWPKAAMALPIAESDESLFRGYSKLLWLKDAILYRSKLVQRKPLRAYTGFEQSHLYCWHEASIEHRRAAKRILSDLELHKP